MTYNEIINELEKLLKNQESGYITALEYGGHRDIDHENYLNLLSETIDLINSLQREKEWLEQQVITQGVMIDELNKACEIIELKEKVGEDNA